ncbi:MAG: TRAP transporter substrate-binding protein [Dehalococcoidia bacterium]|nr:MAG: TRAP transporter substrate-binding protein [Dehalococcoidia bacterium]UCG82601.1 MAG: TRAP transporter substrate-binding protein [Dehalococcoidia bacterium]
MTRLAVLLGLFLLLTLMPGVVGCGDEAEETPALTLKLAHSVPPGHTTDQVAQEFARLIKEYSEGRILVDIYPNAALIGAEALWEALNTGTMDVYVESSWWISSWVPSVYAFFMDGLWESWEHGYAVMDDGRVSQILADSIEEAGQVKMLRVLSAGLMLGHITKDKEITHLKDLEGLRTNTSPGYPAMPIHEYAGLEAVPIALEETTIAFTQGIIDSVCMTPTALRQGHYYDIGKHMYWRPGSFRTNLCMMNGETWENLPVDIQDILINRVAPELEDFSRRLYQESEAADIEFLEEQVYTVNWMTSEQAAEFWEGVKGHPTMRVQLLMVDPKIIDIIQELRPSVQ